MGLESVDVGGARTPLRLGARVLALCLWLGASSAAQAREPISSSEILTPTDWQAVRACTTDAPSIEELMTPPGWSDRFAAVQPGWAGTASLCSELVVPPAWAHVSH
jgi:hypothetical protein